MLRYVYTRARSPVPWPFRNMARAAADTSRFLPVFVERSSGKNRIILSSVDGARSQDGARCGVSFSGAAGTREPFAFQVPVRLSGAGISLA